MLIVLKSKVVSGISFKFIYAVVFFSSVCNLKILSKNTTNSVIPKTLQPKNESSYYLTKDNELQIL